MEVIAVGEPPHNLAHVIAGQSAESFRGRLVQDFWHGHSAHNVSNTLSAASGAIQNSAPERHNTQIQQDVKSASPDPPSYLLPFFKQFLA
jgi:hypothetical protein